MRVSAPCLSERKMAQSSLEGPACAQPMQLRSMSGSSRRIEQGRLTGIDSRKGKGKGKDNAQPLQRSECFAYQSHVLFRATADLEKISASLFAPAPHPTPILRRLSDVAAVRSVTPLDSDDDLDDSGVETEPESLDESQLTELAQRFPSNVWGAVAIEVRFFLFFVFFFVFLH